MSKEQYWQLAEFTSLIPAIKPNHTGFCFTEDDVTQAKFNALTRSHRKELNKLKIKRAEQLTGLYNEICHEFDIGKLSKDERYGLIAELRENYLSCIKALEAHSFTLPEKVQKGLDSDLVNKALVKIKKYNSEIAEKFAQYKTKDLVDFNYLDQDGINAHYYQWLGVKPIHAERAAQMYGNLITAVKEKHAIAEDKMPLRISKETLAGFLENQSHPLKPSKVKEPDIQSASSNDQGHASRLRESFFRGPSRGIAQHIGTPVHHVQKAGSRIMKQARGG